MILKLLTLALTTLIVIPAGAHLFEFPAKIGITEADYFTVQSIYAGWGLFAVAILASITRLRRSSDRGLLIQAGILSSLNVESDQT